MNWKSPRLWIGFVSIMIVAFVAVVDMSRKSPGPLAAVHGRESELEGSLNCSECHGGWLSTMTESCLECHKPIAEDIETSEGLHGAVGKEKAARCAVCHSEHHGVGFAIVNRQSFAKAGAKGPDEFDHLFVGFLMDGAHLELDCTECHTNAKVDVLAKGEARFGGLDRDCASCHEDPHEGRMALACAACHGQTTWDGLHSLGHDRFLPLVGGHGDVGCRECHAESTSHSLEILGSGGVRPKPRECVDCHESPHAEGFANAAAALAPVPAASAGTTCVACHAAEHDTFRDQRLALSAEQHACSGFPLDVPHDQVECASCHAPDAGDFAARYPGRGPDACSRCHADVHEGQFAVGPFAGQECTACHAREHFEPHAFTTEMHARSSLELSGRHLEIECQECHLVPEEGGARAFHGVPSDCDRCHADAHAGFFADFTLGLPAVKHGECARCHDTAAFAALPAEGFEHERWTDFPVLGAHAQAECESCHPLAEAPDDTGRRFGRVAEEFGAFDGCITCHDDPHRGQFDGPSHSVEVAGRTDCARCHEESSFRSFPYGFDHGAWTGFHLVGAHGEADCSACHEPLTRPDALGRTWQHAAGPGCADCHMDPHAGQFRVEGVVDCQRCHTSRVASYLAFNHERDARFALGEAHSKLECGACHHEWSLPSGDPVVRYRPLGIECVDCHGVQEGGLLRRKQSAK